MKSISSLRTRMIIFSLCVSLVIGAALFATGGLYSLLAAISAALITALICSSICSRSIMALRQEQGNLVDYLNKCYAEDQDRAEQPGPVPLSPSDEAVLQLFHCRKKECQELVNLICETRDALGSILQSRLSGGNGDLGKIHEAVRVMDTLNSAYSVIIAELESLSARAGERASISTQMSATTDAIAENINHYSGFVLETSSSIEQMACNIRQTAENIKALSDSTEQTVCSLNEIGASQETVRDNSERSSTVSKNVRNQAQHGLRCMAATMKAMQEIAKSNEESFESINRLSRHSARVGEFLRVIQDVVEQTRLLSLNASIIAAQAGARGKAFAVVAEEVRSLAQRTSSSTREIEELVRNIQKETSVVQRTVTQGKDKVKEGVKISAMANDALVTIDSSAVESLEMVVNIASATSEQSVNFNRITEEANKNLERVQQAMVATDQQQFGANLIVNNLESLRELAHRINSSAQEQAKGNRLYLRSVMEDNERTCAIKNEAQQNITLISCAVEVLQELKSQIDDNSLDTGKLASTLSALTAMTAQGKNASAEGADDE